MIDQDIIRPTCKKYSSENIAKNRIVRGKQRYKRTKYTHNIAENNQHTHDSVLLKKPCAPYSTHQGTVIK